MLLNLLSVFCEYYKVAKSKNNYVGVVGNKISIVHRARKTNFTRELGYYSNAFNSRILFRSDGRYRVVGVSKNTLVSSFYPGNVHSAFEFTLTKSNKFVIMRGSLCVIRSGGRGLKIGNCSNALELDIEKVSDKIDLIKGDNKKNRYSRKDRVMNDILKGNMTRTSFQMTPYVLRNGKTLRRGKGVTEWYLNIL